MKNVLLSILFIAGFTVSSSAAELTGTLQQIQKSGKIRIGYRESLPPMSFLGKNGSPEGYSIDLCNHIVTGVEKKIGSDIDIEYVAVTVNDRFTALPENKIDILCGATTMTLSRREMVDFTKITFVTGGSYLTLRSSKIRKKFNGKKIGVTQGTTTAIGLEAYFKEKEDSAEIVRFNDTDEGYAALREGTIDAFSADQIVLIGLVLTEDDPTIFSILPDMFSYEPLALAVRRNDADFRLVADRVLTGLFRTKEIETIYDKWMGKFFTDMPPVFEALIELNSISEE